MKYFLPLIFFILSSAYAGTCTTTSRSNYSNGQVLTSTALNADFNQLVTKVNSLDGGCVTDGSLEAAALNSTDYATVLNGIHQGCSLSYSDANTVLVGKCIASVNGNFIKTATASTATWGCSGCASEVASTQYYVYIKTGSSGTTLNPLISTTAPNADGYDNSGNKIVGRFYNNSASSIDQNSIESWSNGGYSVLNGRDITPGASHFMENFMFSFGGASATTVCGSSPCATLKQFGTAVSSVTRSGAGLYVANFPKTYAEISCTGSLRSSTDSLAMYPEFLASSNTMTITNGAATDLFGTVYCQGY